MRRKLQKYDTKSSITIVPTVDDDETDYACEARHPAIPIDKPMRATVKLSVFCKYKINLIIPEFIVIATLSPLL